MQAQRDQSIDALRALALFGILVVNLPFFAMPYGFAGPAWQENGALWPNIAAAALIQGLFESKFILIFSALFGYGAWVQLSRHGLPRYLRRLAALVLFGIVNLAFLFEADVLLPYAVLGLFLPALRRWRAANLMALSLGLWALSIVGAVAFCISVLVAEPSGGDDARPLGELLAGGGFLEIMQWRLSAWVEFQTYCLWSTYPLVAAAFIAGFAAGQVAERRGLGEFAASLSHLARLLVLPALVGALAYGAIASVPAAYQPENLFLLSMPMRPVFAPPLALVIAGAALSLFRAPRMASLTGALAPAGRLSLTVYLGMSLVMSLIFFGYGLGLHGTPSLADTLWISTALYIGFILACRSWESLFGRGPAERLLRLLVGANGGREIRLASRS